LPPRWALMAGGAIVAPTAAAEPASFLADRELRPRPDRPRRLSLL
jgi:hypothetical protein